VRRPADAYREGYERGRRDNLADNVGQAVFGLFRDDPGGHFQAGYHDGAAGKKFRPPADEVRKPAAELNPFDDKVAIKIVCPNCGALDWFEWKFLGRLKDPVCGHTWYAGSGTYTVMQIRAGFGAGNKFAKHITSGVTGEGAWLFKAPFWCAGIILGLAIRLEFGVMMIPIQAIVGICQPHKTTDQILSRSIAIVVPVAILALLIYQSSRMPSGTMQQSSMVQSPVLQQPSPPISPTPDSTTASPPAGNSMGGRAGLVQPSFNCGKARTKVELLICRDSRLAVLEVEMASAYKQTLSSLPPDGQIMLRKEQLAWLKNYGRTCNQSVNDIERANCVAGFLSNRTRILQTPRTIAAAPPSSLQQSNGRLPVDLARHCRSHGYNGVRNKDGSGYGWVCTPGDASLSVDEACREQYGNGFSAGLTSPPPGGMNDWFCRR
jgi:uncharacterized protein YecT (DUF1311 family)